MARRRPLSADPDAAFDGIFAGRSPGAIDRLRASAPHLSTRTHRSCLIASRPSHAAQLGVRVTKAHYQ